MSAQFWINKDGTYRKVKQFWVNKDGVWRQVKTAFVNKDGTFRKFFSGGPSASATDAFLSATNWGYVESYVEIRLNPDGSTSTGQDWATPIGSGASSLWVKFNVTYGAGLGASFTFGQWVQVSTVRTISVTSSGGAAASAEGTYQVSTGGTDSTAIGGGDWYLAINE